MLDWTAILQAALGVSGPIASSIISGTKGKQLKKRLSKLVQSNSELQNKLSLAYNNKNSSLLNSLLTSTPLGAAYHSLKNEIAEADKEYASKLATLQKQASNITDMQNDVESAISDPKYLGAPGLISSVNKLNAVDKAVTAAEQAVKGGIIDGL